MVDETEFDVMGVEDMEELQGIDELLDRNAELEAEIKRLRERLLSAQEVATKLKIENNRLCEGFIKYAEHDVLCDYLDTNICTCGCGDVLKTLEDE